ncbi:MAG: DsbA family oxidoreductase [Humibacillus sp.]|nr:DsbA family oxidoreductase [Humibacillus sp.]MDN5776655.1 DsbA family oxidoreductase [Humibacillus sp.]
MSVTNQQAAESTTAIDLALWVDLVCPWSWLARRRLDAAVAAFERPADVTITLRAFELEPDFPRGSGISVAEHLGSRQGGGVEVGRLMNAKVDQASSGDGLVFDWRSAVWANTFDAHRLCALALAMGGHALQLAAAERFWSAHFTEGLAIDDPRVLQRTGAECGLDERRVASVLAGDEFAEQVRADERAASTFGMTSVPVLVANGYAALAGARAASDYLALLRGVATGAGAESGDGSSARGGPADAGR